MSYKIIQDIKKYQLGTSDFKYNEDARNVLYPISLSFTLDSASFYYDCRDESGLPIKNYKSVGYQYNPTRIAAYALANFEKYKILAHSESRDEFIKCANWFVRNSDGRHCYNFKWGDLNKPWISCMAQGEAASVLVRAYYLTNDSIYIDSAKKSLAPFFVSIECGGVMSKIDKKYIFLEEYPTQNPAHVLNGFMYALIGLYDFNIIANEVKFKILFDDLIESLSANINNWSAGEWSLYDYPRVSFANNYCTSSYHNLHVSQLRWFTDRFHSSEIADVLCSWDRGSCSYWVRNHAMIRKMLYRAINKAQR
jgi:heparosan-N-sulfate-glucuronate 5-epimerase